VIGTKPETAGATMREYADLGIARVWMHRGRRGAARKKPEQISNKATITTKPISSCSAIRAVADHQVGRLDVAVRQTSVAQLADQRSTLSTTWSSTGAAGPARGLQQVDGQSGCPGEVFTPAGSPLIMQVIEAQRSWSWRLTITSISSNGGRVLAVAGYGRRERPAGVAS